MKIVLKNSKESPNPFYMDLPLVIDYTQSDCWKAFLRMQYDF